MTEAPQNQVARFSRWAFAAAMLLFVVGFCSFAFGAIVGLGPRGGRADTPLSKAMMYLGCVGMGLAEIATVTALVTSLMGWKRGRGGFPYVIVPISGIVIAVSLWILWSATWGMRH